MRHPETCVWFLKSEKFRTWEAERQMTLFCQGVLGAGKTVLTSVVVDYLHSKYSKNNTCTIALAFVYFSHDQQKEQKCEEILYSVLKQLLRKSVSPPEEVVSLYNNHKVKAILPTLGEVSTALRATASTFQRVFIVIDALDECDTAEKDLLLPHLFRLRDECHANLFFTARPLPNIRKNLKGSIIQNVRAQDQDIETYVRHKVDQTMQLVLEESPQLKDQIVAVIVKESDGM